MHGAYFEHIGCLSDVGKKRQNNEDAYTFIIPPQNKTNTLKGMLAICDGMGGHAAGEVASQLATTHWQQFCQQWMQYQMNPLELETLVKQGIAELHQKILDYAQKHHKPGMGCTLVSALLLDQQVLIANVGDSGAFLCRAGQCEAIYTTDNELERLLQAGQISAEMAANSAFKSHLLQAIGFHGTVEPHLCWRHVYHGDRLVLCSDGLTAHVSPQEFAEILARFPEDQQAASYLVQLANKRGGTDNITVIVATVASTSPQPRMMVFDTPTQRKPSAAPRKASIHWLLSLSIILLGLGVGIIAGALKPYRKKFPPPFPAVRNRRHFP